MVILAHAGGRPKIIDEQDLILALNIYTENTDDPIIPEFCAGYGSRGISKQHLYELAESNAELADSIKRLVTKQEASIVRGAVTGKTNPIFAIFRLKQQQFGWADKQEIVSTNTNTNISTATDMAQVDNEELLKKIDAIKLKLVK